MNTPGEMIRDRNHRTPKGGCVMCELDVCQHTGSMMADLSSARLKEFSDKYCGGKEPDLEMVRDMARALGFRLTVKLVDKE